MSGVTDLDAHLAAGVTSVCRCWRVTRRDGLSFGFTDHDRTITFDGVSFRASTGLTASALTQSSGLSVDNAEVIGALSDAAITEADIVAGRFDQAAVEAWLVQWDASENRVLQFRGSFGEVSRTGDAFRVELRGLAEEMNTPTGRVYQRSCEAVLGDDACGVDLGASNLTAEAVVSDVEYGRVFRLAEFGSFEPRWFERGRLEVLSGAASGLAGAVKVDRIRDGLRYLELWDRLRAPVGVGDHIRLTAGCDKRIETCRLKFGNIVNFRGFPDIPGTDWLVAHPTRLGTQTGGSRR